MSDSFFAVMQNEIFAKIISGQGLTDSFIYSNLLIACKDGLTHWVVELLKYDSTKELINKQEGIESPLILACQGGYVDICDLLIANGADVNIIVGQYQMTPLRVATMKDDINIVSLLLNNGADPNIEYFNGTTPLFVCKSENVLHQILNYGGDFNHRDNIGDTALYKFYSMAQYEPYAKLGKILLGYGADPNIIYKQYGTIINLLILKNSWDNAIELLRAGADLNICDIPIHECPIDVIITKCKELIKIIPNDIYPELFMIKTSKYFLMKISTLIENLVIRRRINRFIGDSVKLVEFLYAIPSPILEEIYDAIQQEFP